MNNTHITTRVEITFWSILIKMFNLIRTAQHHLEQIYSQYSLEINLSLGGLIAGLVLGFIFAILNIR